MSSGPVFIGFDSRSPRAYEVAARSLLLASGMNITPVPIIDADARRRLLYWRPSETDAEGRLIDSLSGAPMSTEFAITRFLVPFLTRERWALFVDQDVIFLRDVRELFALADPRYAVMCVKHEMPDTGAEKMHGQLQTRYPRKNWSSVTLWNLDHPAHRRLTLSMVNQYPGELLHRFFWLRDSEIGSLPAAWNWLVNVQDRPADVGVAHFTLGGPWIESWEAQPNDDIWLDAATD